LVPPLSLGTPNFIGASGQPGRIRRPTNPASFRPCRKGSSDQLAAATEQRDELAPFQLIELHSVPPLSARTGFQDIELQAISQRACWNFATSLGSAERPPRYTFGTMNAQIER